MSFRSRKSFVLLGGWSAFEGVDEVDPESGRSVHKRINVHKEKLPDRAKFELDTLMKAGVPLQMTRTQILPSDVSGIAAAISEESAAQFDKTLSENEQSIKQ